MASAGRNGKTKAESGAWRRKARGADENKDREAFRTVLTAMALGIAALFLYLSYFGLGGVVGRIFGGTIFGIFGWSAWILPAGAVVGYVFSSVNRGDRRAPRKIISLCAAVCLMLGITDIIFKKQIMSEYYSSNRVMHHGLDCVNLTLEDVLADGRASSGMIGRAASGLFSFFTGHSGFASQAAAILIMAALLVLCLFIFSVWEILGGLRKKRERGRAPQKKQRSAPRQSQDGRLKKPDREYRPQRKSGGVMQTVNLLEMNRALDEMEAASHKKAADGGAMEEIVAKDDDADRGAAMPDKNNGAKKNKKPDSDNVKKSADEAVFAAERSGRDLDDVPIFRSELSQKFGRSAEKAKNEEGFIPISVDNVMEEIATDLVREDVGAALDFDDAPPIKEKKDELRAADDKIYDADLDERMETEVEIGADLNEEKEEDADVLEKAYAAPKEAAAINEDVPEKNDWNTPKPGPRKEASAGYVFPDIKLLGMPRKMPYAMSDDELKNTALKLQETLKSFNVNVNMGAVTCGPAVTRYEVLPEQGVRVNKITNLADDLKLSLAAPSIRIEAPIPGKSAVGIEVPNAEPGSVALRELLDSDGFKKSKSPVTFAVGKDIGGNVIISDIAKMPHLLIAGATGSGKSVCINTLIMSILYKADPKDVKLIMIDPKVVELSVYNGIPHLFCPVVTDPKEAAAALNWAVREMMERYNKFKELGVRNISGFNEKIKTFPDADALGYAKMPSLVIIVDEFADLMMVASKEVEDSVCRLAQLARAAGIHLVLATQRPSVNVITGVIKANIPSRIAFSVSSAIDSRTILDKGGAEKLLGKGDMLFFPSGYSEPVRVQGAFVSDKEVGNVVEFLCSNNEEPEYNDGVTKIIDSDAAPEDEKDFKPDRDEYFEEAGRFVIDSGRAAAGQLQRRFSIGFNRAGRIIDQLNKAGVVGPAEGTKPRKVIMSMNDFDLLMGHVPAASDDELEEAVRGFEGGNEEYDEQY